MTLATTLPKAFYYNHTTGTTNCIKIMRMETGEFFNFTTGHFETVADGSEEHYPLTESAKISGMHELVWNSGDIWTDGLYVVAFYSFTHPVAVDILTLRKISVFTCFRDMINIVNGFNDLPAG